jgi:hypothetical protein
VPREVSDDDRVAWNGPPMSDRHPEEHFDASRPNGVREADLLWRARDRLTDKCVCDLVNAYAARFGLNPAYFAPISGAPAS